MAEPDPYVRNRTIVYIGTSAALALLALITVGMDWRATAEQHVALEVPAALLAAVVGSVAFARYRARHDLTYLLIALGFLGAAALDGFHAYVAAPHSISGRPSTSAGQAVWGWTVSRFFLAIMLLLAWWAWQPPRAFDARSRRSDVLRARLVVAGGLVLVLITGWAAMMAAPPDVYLPLTGLLVHRPFEFIPGLLFLGAFIGFWATGGWRRDPFEHALLISLLMHAAVQTLFMPFALGLDARMVMGHLLKVGAYSVTLFGVVFGMYGLFRTAESTQLQLSRANTVLTREIRQRLDTERELERQKSDLDSVLDSMADAVVFAGPDGRIVRANPASERILGYAVTDPKVHAQLETWDVDGQPVPKEQRPMFRALAGETVTATRIQVQMPGHEPRWLSVSARPVRSPEGIHLGAVSVIRDVTEEVQRAEAALEREQTFRAMMEEVQDYAIFLLDPDGRVMTWNRGAARLVGYSAEEAVGKRLDALFSPADHNPHLHEELLNTARREGRAENEGWRLRKDGTQFFTHTVITAAHDRESRLLGFTIVKHDLTQQREADKRLRESEARYRLLADNATDLVTTITPSGIIRYASPAAAHVVGRHSDELVGSNVFHQIHDDDREDLRRALLTVLQDTDAHAVTVRFSHATRGAIWTECRMRWMGGAPEGSEDLILCTWHDINARVETQEALRRSNDELQEFAFIASHDLKEPLRKVTAFGDRLVQRYGDVLEDTGRDYVYRMTSASQRMTQLLEDLLQYSRVTTQGRPFETVPLDDVVQDVLEDLSERLEETGGDVEVQPLPAIEADAVQMRQVFQNLIGNGLKYHREGVAPQVTVRAVSATDREVVVEVTDNGIGLDNRFADRIFRPFQRLHGRGTYEGTGMGLAIVRKIMERHNGSISVDGRPGEGCTFQVRLPRRQPAPDKSLLPPASHPDRASLREESRVG